MARGRGSKNQRGFKRKKKSNFTKNLSKKQRGHIREYGEQHPSESLHSEQTRYKKIYDEPRPKKPVAVSDDESLSSEDEPEVNPLNELLSTFSNISNDGKHAGIKYSEESSDGDNSLSEDAEGSISSGEENHVEFDAVQVPGEEKVETDECIIDHTAQSDEELTDNEGKEQQEDEDVDRLDPFQQHFENVLPEALVESIEEKVNWATATVKLPTVGNVSYTYLTALADATLPSERKGDLTKLWVKSQLHLGWEKSNAVHLEEGVDSPFTDFQNDMYAIISSYKDMLFCGRKSANAEVIRGLYCLHAVNHILKTRNKIVHHNSKLAKRDDVPEEFRDQGLTRPKVLILVPFRESALRVVQLFISILLPDEKANIINKKRFMDEFGDPDTRKTGFRFIPKPPDHEETFSGNVDDSFRIGISVTKKSLRLYADFYSADIVVASPLGLRILIGADGEKNREFDFLSSIEVLIIDQAEVMLMQNWEHLLHSLAHFHLQPKESHGVDFSRVRPWTLNGWSKFYRQTLCFTSIVCPEFNAVFSRSCCNFAGIVRVQYQVVGGFIQQVAIQLPQVFQRFQASSLQTDAEMRFQYFVSKILPQYKEAVMKRTLIFVSSYFDFVRLRNYFRKEDFSFVQICEYTSDGKVAQARTRFYERQRKFLLYTERVHFYKRCRIKGVHHIIFYQLPIFPHFYSELCNLPQLCNSKDKVASSQTNLTCTVLFSRYDVHRLAAIVGTSSAAEMLSSEKDVHLFVTGDS